MRISKIYFNGIEEPLGYHYTPLIVSWLVEDAIGEMQTSASLQIAKEQDFSTVVFEKHGDLDSLGLAVELELQPYTRYLVRIEVYSDKGNYAQAISHFETGKMAEKWDAEWIGPVSGAVTHPLLSTSFAAGKPVQSARLYITGVGLYEAYLNQAKIGDEVLTPFVNNYDAFIQVQSYDVTSLLGEQNELAILLGDGWYKGRFGLQGEQAYFGDRLAAIAELVLHFEDGEVRKIVTDESWTCTGSAITVSGIYDGETIDRTADTNTNLPAQVIAIDKNKLLDRVSPSLKVQEILTVKEIIKSPAGEVILDFGQNFAGWLEFTGDFAKGHKVHFEFGEILQHGNFYNRNYGTATAGFAYISGGTRESVRPHFTYFGFRYVRVTGWDSIQQEDIRGLAIYSDLERTGYIETGEPKLNQLFSNSLWGLKSNFLDMPTDCPQRAERLGWTGDAQVFAPAASYHMDTRAFYRKYLFDMRTEQLKLKGSIPNYMPVMDSGGGASVWGDAATFIPAALLKNYGCVAEVAQYYPLMKEWVDWLSARIAQKHGTAGELNDSGFQFGDWLALDGATPSSFKGSTDETYIATVYYYESLRIVADIAGQIGKADEAQSYSELAQTVKDRILFEYYTPAGRLSVDTQAAYIIALKFSVYTDKQVIINQLRTRMKKDLYKIKGGFVGAPVFCQVLAENGMVDLAYDFLLQEDFPSWLYAVNLGATTIWERWNSVLPDGTMNPAGMNSLNHYSYGAVMEFVYEYAAGIRPEGNGFRRVILAPNPHAQLSYVFGSYQSTAGKIVSNWSILEDGTLRCYFEVPFNVEATIVLPYSTEEPFKVTSGIYEYTYQPAKDLRTMYNLDTRLSVIKKNAKAFGQLLTADESLTRFVQRADEEQLNFSIREVANLFFTGVTREAADKAEQLLLGMTVSR